MELLIQVLQSLPPRAVWAGLVGPFRDFLFLFSGFFFCYFFFLKN
jgi:hypothetical protein